jgi:hypothetical protein
MASQDYEEFIAALNAHGTRYTDRRRSALLLSKGKRLHDEQISDRNDRR